MASRIEGGEQFLLQIGNAGWKDQGHIRIDQFVSELVIPARHGGSGHRVRVNAIGSDHEERIRWNGQSERCVALLVRRSQDAQRGIQGIAWAIRRSQISDRDTNPFGLNHHTICSAFEIHRPSRRSVGSFIGNDGERRLPRFRFLNFILDLEPLLLDLYFQFLDLFLSIRTNLVIAVIDRFDPFRLGSELVHLRFEPLNMVFDVRKFFSAPVDFLLCLFPTRSQLLRDGLQIVRLLFCLLHTFLQFVIQVALGGRMRMHHRDDQDQNQRTDGTQKYGEKRKHGGSTIISPWGSAAHPARLFQDEESLSSAVEGSSSDCVSGRTICNGIDSGSLFESLAPARRRTLCRPR